MYGIPSHQSSLVFILQHASCPLRGLVPGETKQTFEIRVTSKFRTFYDRIMLLGCYTYYVRKTFCNAEYITYVTLSLMLHLLRT